LEACIDFVVICDEVYLAQMFWIDSEEIWYNARCCFVVRIYWNTGQQLDM